MKSYSRSAMVLLLLIQVTTIKAQSKIDWAVKGGISIPNLTSGTSGNPVSDGYSSRTGFDGAVAAEWHLSSKFSFQPQLEYSQQGGKKNGLQAFTTPPEMAQGFPPGQVPQYLYADYKSTAKLNYLMLPVLAKYYFTRGQWRPYISAGPFLSLLLSAHNVSSGSSIVFADANQTQPISAAPVSFDSNDDVKSDLHSWNTGISGHVGLQHKIAGGALFLEAGGNYGFINIQKNAVNGNNKTGAAVINAGYQFRL